MSYDYMSEAFRKAVEEVKALREYDEQKRLDKESERICKPIVEMLVPIIRNLLPDTLPSSELVFTIRINQKWSDDYPDITIDCECEE